MKNKKIKWEKKNHTIYKGEEKRSYFPKTECDERVSSYWELWQDGPPLLKSIWDFFLMPIFYFGVYEGHFRPSVSLTTFPLLYWKIHVRMIGSPNIVFFFFFGSAIYFFIIINLAAFCSTLSLFQTVIAFGYMSTVKNLPKPFARLIHA